MLRLFVTLSLIATVLSCTDYDECIKNPPKLDAFPVTEEKIRDSCRQYDEYQSCVTTWADRCLQGLNRIEFEMLMGKSVGFLRALCMNNTFQKEYLNEKDSFEKINTGWTQCQNALTDKVKEVNKPSQNKNEEENKKNLIEICCAVDKFNECVDSLCTGKCSKNGEQIYNDILLMVKDTSALNCDQISYKSECKNSSMRMSINTALLVFVIITKIFIY